MTLIKHDITCSRLSFEYNKSINYISYCKFLEPNSIPTTVEELDRFGDEGIESLENFYGKESNENPPLIDLNALSPQDKTYKVFVLKKRMDYKRPNKRQE